MPSKPVKRETPKTFEITVRGIRYYVTPSTLARIQKSTPIPVRLEREPGNTHDKNAIKVIIEAEPWKGFHIGHVARQTASELAPRMDAGTFKPTGGMLMWLRPEHGEGGVILKV